MRVAHFIRSRFLGPDSRETGRGRGGLRPPSPSQGSPARERADPSLLRAAKRGLTEASIWGCEVMVSVPGRALPARPASELLAPSPHPALGSTLEDLGLKAGSEPPTPLPGTASRVSPSALDPVLHPRAPTGCPATHTTHANLCKGERPARGHSPGVTRAGTGESWPILTQICPATSSSAPSEWP